MDFGLDRLKLVERPELRPQRLTRRHDGWELDNLPVIDTLTLGGLLDDLTREVALRPPRHNDDDGTTGLQTLARTGGVPLVDLVIDFRVEGSHGCLLFGVRVVDHEHVSALTRDGTTDTDSEVLAHLGCCPSTRCLGVGCQLCGREDCLIVGAIDEVLDLTAKAHCKLRGVCGLDHLLVRELSHEPCREEIGRELRLGVSRRHVDNQTLQGAIGNTLEGICHDLVVPASDEGWPHLLDEWQKVQLRFFDLLLALKLLEVTEKLLLLSQWQLRDFGKDVVVLSHGASICGQGSALALGRTALTNPALALT